MKKSSFYRMAGVLGLVVMLAGVWLTLPRKSAEAQVGWEGWLAGRGRSLDPPPDTPNAEVLPPREEGVICPQGAENVCIYVFTGTVRSVFNISNPNGISGFQDYHLANVEQRLIGATSTSIDVEVIARYYVDTHAPYPVLPSLLSEDMRNDYLQPQPGWIQSDDPEIVAQANALVAGASLQAEAVDAILTWVSAHIDYDYDAPGNDAAAVFRNRRAVCAGFTTLSVALLRAAGIPARYHRGCATPFGYRTEVGGGWHAWVETYYPDVGWVASEPQSAANIMDPEVISHGFDQCGGSGTVITRTSHAPDTSYLYALRTSYDPSIKSYIRSASIPAWDRSPLRVTPGALSTMLPVTHPVGDFTLQVANLSCEREDWQARTAAPWLSPTVVTGATAGEATFSVQAAGLPTGSYRAPLTLYTTSSSWDWDLQWAISRTVTAQLFLVDRVYQTHLPIIARSR